MEQSSDTESNMSGRDMADGSTRKVVIQAPSACPFSGVAIDPAMWESFQAKLATNNHQHHQERSDLLQRRKSELDILAMVEEAEAVGDPGLHSSDARSLSPARPMLRRSKTNNFRVRVVNETTKRSKDIVVDRNGKDSIFNAIYDHPSVKEAHVRKWGSQISNLVKSGKAEIKLKVAMGDNVDCLWFTLDELKETTTGQLYRIVERHQGLLSLVIYLVCVSTGNEEVNVPIPEEEDLDKPSLIRRATTSNFRIRVVNQTTKRNKDMVLPKNSQKDLFETIYNHPSVKAAHIRKWGSEIAKEVKSGKAEIKVHVVIGEHRFCRWFTVDELKETTTQQLYEIAENEDSLDEVTFNLVCVPVGEDTADGEGTSEDTFAENAPTPRTNNLNDPTVAEQSQQVGLETPLPTSPSVATKVSMASEPAAGAIPELSQQSDAQPPIGPSTSKPSSTSTNFRIRVVNKTTKRSKDMVLTRDGQENLFDSIYNHPSVKAAHVRKWGSEIAKEVKSGTAEIKVNVAVGEDSFSHWFTVDELKETTTKQLHQMVQDQESLDALVFNLVRVPKERRTDSGGATLEESLSKLKPLLPIIKRTISSSGSTTSQLSGASGRSRGTRTSWISQHTVDDSAWAALAQQVGLQTPPATASEDVEGQPREAAATSNPPLLHQSESTGVDKRTPVALSNTKHSTSTTNFRICVVNQVSNRSKDMMLEKGGQENLFDAIYNHPSVKAAHVRKWGSEIAKEVKGGKAEIKVKVTTGEEAFCQWFTVDELKETTTEQLCQMVGDQEHLDTLAFNLVCVSTGMGTHNGNGTSEEILATETTDVPSMANASRTRSHGNEGPLREAAESAIPPTAQQAESSGDAMALVAPSNPKKSTTITNFRIHVVNQTTKRSKDLVLTKDGRESLFDAIYNHQSVKAAHVRKWGPQIAKQVKNGKAEIKVKFMAGEEEFCQWFTIDELKETTTQQLYQMVETKESLDSLVFNLVCVSSGEGFDNEEKAPAENLATETLLEAREQVELGAPLSGLPSENDEGPMTEPEKIAVQQATEPSNSASDAMPLVAPSNPKKSTTITSFRIHVVNQTTKRSKDLVLTKDGQESLFDAIYNHQSVKAAHVRKWDSKIAKEVKTGKAEIKTNVTVGTDSVCRWFTVDELKETTAQQLYQMVEDKESLDTLVFNLVCVSATEDVGNVKESSGEILATRTALEPRQQVELENPPSRAPSEDDETPIKEAAQIAIPLPVQQKRATGDSIPLPAPSAPNPSHSTTDNSFRIHVVNQTTMRSKDLVLTKDGQENLFDAIYDHPSVKAAHVQRWGSEIAKEVKSGKAEIKVNVKVGADSFCQWFTVDGLKQTTTQRLHRMVEDKESLGTLVFNLVCVSVGENIAGGEVVGEVAGQVQDPKMTEAATSADETALCLSHPKDLIHKREAVNDVEDSLKPQLGGVAAVLMEASQAPEGTLPKQASSDLKQRGATTNFRIRVVNQTTKRSKDMVLDKHGKDNLFDAIYNHPSVKSAHIRKWGSEIAKQVKTGQSTIKVKIVIGEDTIGQWYRVEELKEITIEQLYQQVGDDEGDLKTLVFNLVCVPEAVADCSLKSGDVIEQGKEKRKLKRHASSNSDYGSEGPGSMVDESISMSGSMNMMRTLSIATSSNVDSAMSEATMSISMLDVDYSMPQKLETLAPIQDKVKTTLGVRVINQTTQRHKDLVVDISDTNSVFDTVYDHPGVKSAHVRKWGGAIARAVKNGTSKIKFLVWDDDTQKPWKVFSIDELKLITTRQLYEMVSESSNLIKVYLKCVSADDDEQDDDTTNNYNNNGLSTAVSSMTSINTNNTFKTQNGSSLSSSNKTQLYHDQKQENAIKPIAEEKVPTVPMTPKRQASLRLGKNGRPTHSRPRIRRQASLRLEKNGRPQFSIETTIESDAPVVPRPTTPVKKTRPNHMKWLAAHIPRNGSCPTMQQMVAIKRNESMQSMQARIASHGRLVGLNSQSPRAQVLQSSKSECAKGSMLRQAARVGEQTKSSFTMSLNKRDSQTSQGETGSKNVLSKNATWQPKKAGERNTNAGTNKLLSSLMKATPAPVKPPSREVAPTKQHAPPKQSLGKNPGPALRRSHTNPIPGLILSRLKQSMPTLKTDGAAMEDDSEEIRRNTIFGPEVKSPLEEFQKSNPQSRVSRRERRRRSRRSCVMSRATSMDEVPPLDAPIIAPKLKRIGSDPLSLGSINAKKTEEKKQKLKEFMRLLRAKKLPEFQSQRSLSKKYRSSDNVFDLDESRQSTQRSVPSMVQMKSYSDENSLRSGASALTLNEKDSVCPPRYTRTSTSNASVCSSQTPQDKINRFLGLKKQQPKSRTKTSDKIARFLTLQKSAESDKEETSSKRVSWCEPDPDDMDRSTSMSTRKSPHRGERAPIMDMPPLAEISVIANDDNEPRAPVSMPGVALAPALVKEVFPYHVVVDADFRVIQVGSNLEMLIQESGLVGRFVSDIMTVTSPIPIFGSWDWNILEKMKDKTIFLESVLSPVMEEKVKLKGTLIEVTKSPKQVMFVLFPNVKNLAELEETNLSMADLPLHSCQREAVLLGEHSKSEVNLTNHLDKLHRDLIDSMEQQINERTEELGAANRQLETANSRLAIQSARQLEHFACMSHEIRTPLNCIVGMSSLLLDDADEMDPMHADSIRMINTSGDLLKAVVDDVLDYAKLESGSFEVDIKEANLQHTLNSVAHSISQKVQDKNVRLRLDYSPFLPETVETDSRRLQQVLFNLMGNAGKFSKKNSVIDLTVSVVPVESTDVDPDETSRGEVIRFSVKDYGKGIEKKDFKTIFEPFSQASKETQNVYGGTGLGLSITSKLVHRLGGTVSLQSEYGRYTDFTVDLPLRGREVDVPKLQKRLRNMTLVLVEPPRNYDYSFTKHKIKPEPIPFQASVAEAFELNVMRCNAMDEVVVKIEKGNLAGPTKHFAFLVHEDLYQPRLFDRLDKLVCPLNNTLMTFGPQYSVEMTKDRHFKSLEGVFPSAMLEKIVETMERRKAEKIFSNRQASIRLSPGTAAEAAHAISREIGDAVQKADDSVPPAASGLFAGVPTGDAPSAQSPGGLFPLLNGPTSGGVAKPVGLFTIPMKNGLGSFVAAPSEKQLQPPAAPQVAKEQAQVYHTPEGQPVKVLYAEDNMINQKVLTRVLTKVGVHDLTIVDNGKKAFDITAKQKFDIIFMDVQMPIMGGLEATKLIMERNPSEKVVFVTAHALDEFKAKADAVGATGFLPKPFRPGDVVKLLTDFGYSKPPPGGESNTDSAADRQKASLFSIAGSNDQPLSAQLQKSTDRSLAPGAGTGTQRHKPAPRQQRHSEIRQSLKVLYAEDNKINQKVLARVLARSGIKNLTIVDNGKKAVDITETQKFDLIFMDMQMPIMGGIEATKLIMDRNPSEKVVFLTAHALDEFKTQADAVGATSFYSKPIRPDEIEQLLTDLGFSNDPSADDSNSPTTAKSMQAEGSTGGPPASGALFSTARSDPAKGSTSGPPTSGALFSIARSDPAKLSTQASTGGALFSMARNDIAESSKQAQGGTSSPEGLFSLARNDTNESSKQAQGGTRAAPKSGALFSIARNNTSESSMHAQGGTGGPPPSGALFSIARKDPAKSSTQAGGSTGETPSGGTLFSIARSDPAQDPGSTSGLATGGAVFSMEKGDTPSVTPSLPRSTHAPIAAASQESPIQAKETENQRNPSADTAQPAVVPQGSSGKTKASGKQHNHSAKRKALKVLYAEDNKVNQKVLSRVLARSGIENLTIVDDGVKAVNITKEQSFDIIFMDIQMPNMGGMEATELIVERNPSEKVIFVTAHALDEFKAQAKAVGATSFISKPFRLDDIENLLKELGY